ncbi:MAG TPA: PEGA domain-containing protein [Polyangia bacterium]
MAPRSVALVLALLGAAGAAAAAPERPVILVVPRGGPGPDRAALAALAAPHGRAVFDDDAPRTAGEDPAEAEASRLRARARATAAAARALYYEARPVEAAAQAQALLAEAGETLAYAGAIAELRELWFWLATSLAKAGRAVEAQHAFERAGDLGMTLPEPGLLPPEVTAALEAGLKAAAARPRRRLVVQTIPTGAELTVDGRPAGRAPAIVSLPQGEHYVAAARFGSHPAVRKVAVGPAPEVVLEIALEPASAAELGRQLAALRARGALDLADPAVVGALAQLNGAAEVLTVVRQPLAGRERVAVTRWVPAWRRAAAAETTVPADPDGRRGAIASLADQLWPPPPAPPAAPAAARPLWQRWWVWAIVGGTAAAVAAGVGGWAATRPDTLRFSFK